MGNLGRPRMRPSRRCVPDGRIVPSRQPRALGVLRLYDYLPSGNGYKVRLLLTQLAIPFELVERDIIKGETRTPDFLAKFPNGRIPAVEFEDDKLLFESNAIISYFAENTQFVPQSRFARA